MLEMRRVDPDVLAPPDVVLVASGMEQLELHGRCHVDVETFVGNFMSDAPGGIIKRRIDKNVNGHSPHRDHLVLHLDLCIKPNNLKTGKAWCSWGCLVAQLLHINGLPLTRFCTRGFMAAMAPQILPVGNVQGHM